MKSRKQYELRADRALALQSRYRSLENEALKLINYELTKSRIKRFPLDIEGLKAYLSIRGVRPAQLYSKMEGRLINENDSFIIEVSDKSDAFQSKFTVLHESAHIILEDRLANQVNLERANIKYFSKNIPSKVIEKLCDASTKEMLFPKNKLRAELRGKRPSLLYLTKMSEKYEYPLKFIATRVLESLIWTFRILWWRVVKNRPNCIDSLPYMDELTLLNTKLPEEGNSLILDCHLKNNYIEGKQKIITDEIADEYKIQVLPNNSDTVICMLVYR